MQSQGSVEQYLHANETVEQTVDVESATVYVTDRRVLAFTPAIDGKNFQQAERPNVTGVERRTDEDRSLLWSGAQYALLGGLLTPVGVLVDFGAIFGGLELDSGGTSQFGAGDLISAAETLITALTFLSYALVAIGVLMLGYGVVQLVRYQQGRQTVLELTVAGDGESLRLPAPDTATDVQSRLEQAIVPGVGHGH